MPGKSLRVVKRRKSAPSKVVRSSVKKASASRAPKNQLRAKTKTPMRTVRPKLASKEPTPTRKTPKINGTGKSGSAAGGGAKAPARPAHLAHTTKSTPQVTPIATKHVPSAGKGSNGLTKSDLDRFREQLLEKRRELIGDVGSMENEAFKGGQNLSNMPMHMADVGTDNFEQEFTLGLIESERQLLREIQEALARIEDGTFGICVATGAAIGKPRLDAKPWAKYSIEYTRMLEKGLVRPENEAESAESESAEEEEE